MLEITRHFDRARQLLQPFFVDKGAVTKNRLLLITFLIGKITEAAVLSFLYGYLSTMMGVLALPVITYQAFNRALMDFLGCALILGAVKAVNFQATVYLKTQLKHDLNQDLSSLWFHKDSFYKAKVQGNSAKLPAAQTVLIDDYHEVVEQSFNLFENFLSTFAKFTFGFYKLWVQSGVVTLSFFGREVAAPGLIAIGASMYALGFSFLSMKLSQSYPDDEVKAKKSREQLEKIIHHIDHDAESIALQNTGLKEKSLYKQAYEKFASLRSSLTRSVTNLEIVTTANEQLSRFVALLVSAPSIISKSMALTDFVETAYHVNNIIKFFNFSSNVEDISKLKNGEERIRRFKEQHQRIQSLETQLNHEQGDHLDATVSLWTPNGQTLMLKQQIRSEAMARSLLAGPTGCGKSTLIKAIAGLWPYAEGKVQLPSRESIHIIPQRPSFPAECTLREAILYTVDEPVDDEDMKKGLSELGLNDKIDFLDSSDCVKGLSGGEVQRVALLSAMFQKPKLLVLDESLNALDSATVNRVLNLLDQRLPNTSMLVIDHQYQSHTHFYTHQLHLQKKEPSESELNATPTMVFRR